MKNLFKKGVLILLLCGILSGMTTGCASNDEESPSSLKETANNSVVTSSQLDESSEITSAEEDKEGEETSSKKLNSSKKESSSEEDSSSKKENSSKTETSSKEVSSKNENSSKNQTTSKEPSSKQQTSHDETSKESSSKEIASSSEEQTNSNNTSSKPEETIERVVTCYGDSVTEGMSVGLDENYPYFLGELLGNGYTVQNAGIGGEKTTAIMTRQGGLKLFTMEEISFEKGQTQVLIAQGTTRGLIAEDGRQPTWNAPFGRDLPINDVTINGKKYELQFKNFAWSKSGGPSTCDTYLVRSANTNAETIPANSQVVFATSNTSKTNYADVYFMGFNGTYDNIDDLISQYQMMIDYRNDDNYLVVIPFWEKSINKKAYEKFKSAFGDHAVDAVEYCINGGLEKLGITLEKYDRGCLENEIFPYSLKLNTISNRIDVHLNAKGYRVLANAIYEQGQKINLW